MSPHQCPGCGTPVPATLVGCRPCWRQVPQELRRAVWEAYGQRGLGPFHRLTHLRAVGAAAKWMRENAKQGA